MQSMIRDTLLVAACLGMAATANAQFCLSTVTGGNVSTSAGCAALLDMTISSAIIVQSLESRFTAANGTPVTLDVWVTPNTYVGNHTNQAVWTLVGTASGNAVNGANTPLTLNAPILLQPGSYGVSLVASSNTSHQYTSTAAQVYSDSIMTLNVGAIQGTPWVSTALLSPRIWNGRICYTPASGYALAAPYGTGCYDGYASFYQTFPNGTFNLSNTSLSMFFTGNGYLVLPIGSGWFTPQSANLGLGDDTVSGAQSLGFALPYPGGTITDVYISSNGLIWGGGAGPNGCCAGSAAVLLGNFPCWAPNHGDLNPAAGGSVHFDVDPVTQAAYVTYLGVPEYGTSNLNTFQVAFFASGIVEYRFQNCLQTNRISLTGWSPGGNARNPGPTNLSTLSSLQTVPDQFPVRHGASARPVLGTTINLQTTELPAGTIFGSTLFGLVEDTAGTELSAFGMPGCRRYLTIDASQIWIPGSGSGSTAFAIPNVPALAGTQIKTQGIVLAPGVNALGVASSNGLRLTLDQN